MCLYGEPGIGKTVLAAKSEDPLLIECEKGASISLGNHPAQWEIPVVSILDNPDKLMQIGWELKKGAHPEFKTIIIDTISEYQTRQLAKIWHAERDKGKRPEGHPYQQEYKVNTEYMREVILHYCELDRNVIFIAHEVEEKNEQTGQVITRPMFTPKLASTMFATVDVMLYMTGEVNIKGEMKRMLRATPTRSIKAKDRLGLPSTFDADTLWGEINHQTRLQPGRKDNA